MTEPKCFSCEDQGYLICGNCDKFDELVVVRRDDLDFVITAIIQNPEAEEIYEEVRNLKDALESK